MSRRRTGERHPNAKLTQAQVDEIRASRMGVSEAARHYGVSKATISLIRNNKMWVCGPRPALPATAAQPSAASPEASQPAAPACLGEQQA